jgi:hypothetical protein
MASTEIRDYNLVTEVKNVWIKTLRICSRWYIETCFLGNSFPEKAKFHNYIEMWLVRALPPDRFPAKPAWWFQSVSRNWGCFSVYLNISCYIEMRPAAHFSCCVCCCFGFSKALVMDLESSWSVNSRISSAATDNLRRLHTRYPPSYCVTAA